MTNTQATQEATQDATTETTELRAVECTDDSQYQRVNFGTDNKPRWELCKAGLSPADIASLQWSIAKVKKYFNAGNPHASATERKRFVSTVGQAKAQRAKLVLGEVQDTHNLIDAKRSVTKAGSRVTVTYFQPAKSKADQQLEKLVAQFEAMGVDKDEAMKMADKILS